MMLAQTPAQFAAALLWAQVPTWVIVVSLAGFVRLYLRAGRRGLLWSVFALRSLALLLTFLVGQNLNYREGPVCGTSRSWAKLSPWASGFRTQGWSSAS